MAKRKLRKVLFFIEGASPTDDDREAMEAFGQGHMVCQRNVLHIHDGDPIEEFDIVAGLVPAQYAAAFEAQGEPEEAIAAPPVEAGAVAPGSPLTPPPVDPPVDPPVAPPKAPEAPPKPPEPKPNAAKGWKPNA